MIYIWYVLTIHKVILFLVVNGVKGYAVSCKKACFYNIRDFNQIL